ncbi:hypothetical protein R1sor_020969 [Riccia sorocarpa]|uniref:DUF7780 domain-containing protein n=1 Tax=Riccia sorocarpa TaxID=122646 RepID=A0ABD3GFP5_9MARC
MAFRRRGKTFETSTAVRGAPEHYLLVFPYCPLTSPTDGGVISGNPEPRCLEKKKHSGTNSRRDAFHSNSVRGNIVNGRQGEGGRDNSFQEQGSWENNRDAVMDTESYQSRHDSSRLLERKSASIGSSMGSRDYPLVEKPCPESLFTIEFRSTIFLCVGILFASVFLFCSLDPGKVLEQQAPSFSLGSRFFQGSKNQPSSLPAAGPLNSADGLEPAMQGMGSLFRRGTLEMGELIVAHLSENTRVSDFRLFLRTLHRSGATAKADVILLYDSLFPVMLGVMREEELNFQMLLAESETSWALMDPSNLSVGEFNAPAFWKPEDRKVDEAEANNGTINPLPRWGSIIGFEIQELDPDNELSGFLDGPPVQLRRWLCYQMLLGVVKSKYKHVMLTEMEGVIVIGDALSAVRKKNLIYLTSEDRLLSDVEKVDKSSASPGRPRKVLLQVEDQDSTNNNNNVAGATGEIVKAMKDSIAQVDVKSSKLELITSGDAGQREAVDRRSVEEVGGKKKGKKSDSRRRGSRRGRGASRVVGQQQQEKAKGLIETLYGGAVLSSVEKSRNIVSSGVIMGEIKLMRPLVNKVATEIVRLALERQDRQPFHDKAILNYLVFKSSVLGRRIVDHLRVVTNKDSVVHSLRGTKQENVFWKEKDVRYCIVHGYRDRIQGKSIAKSILKVVHSDICKSTFSRVYVDCSLYANTNGTRSSS